MLLPARLTRSVWFLVREGCAGHRHPDFVEVDAVGGRGHLRMQCGRIGHYTAMICLNSNVHQKPESIDACSLHTPVRRKGTTTNNMPIQRFLLKGWQYNIYIYIYQFIYTYHARVGRVTHRDGIAARRMAAHLL